MTKYFTAPVINDTEKEKRQTTYLEALGTLNYLEIIKGQFLPEPRECPKCKYVETILKEKMTDVSIAVEMLLDAYCNRFDIAVLISADTDLVPPITAIKKKFDNKRIVVFFPPQRFSDHLQDVAHKSLHIGRTHLRDSVFPDRVIREDRYVLERPVTWV